MHLEVKWVSHASGVDADGVIPHAEQRGQRNTYTRKTYCSAMRRFRWAIVKVCDAIVVQQSSCSSSFTRGRPVCTPVPDAGVSRRG